MPAPLAAADRAGGGHDGSPLIPLLLDVHSLWAGTPSVAEESEYGINQSCIDYKHKLGSLSWKQPDPLIMVRM